LGLCIGLPRAGPPGPHGFGCWQTQNHYGTNFSCTMGREAQSTYVMSMPQKGESGWSAAGQLETAQGGLPKGQLVVHNTNCVNQNSFLGCYFHKKLAGYCVTFLRKIN